MTLRNSVTLEQALAYFQLMQEMFNGYFSSSAYAGSDFFTVVAEHEQKLKQALNFMLYGIAKLGEEK